jgi:hypothetical protein
MSGFGNPNIKRIGKKLFYKHKEKEKEKER